MDKNTRPSDNSFVAHAAPPYVPTHRHERRCLLLPITITVLRFPDYKRFFSVSCAVWRFVIVKFYIEKQKDGLTLPM